MAAPQTSGIMWRMGFTQSARAGSVSCGSGLALENLYGQALRDSPAIRTERDTHQRPEFKAGLYKANYRSKATCILHRREAGYDACESTGLKTVRRHSGVGRKTREVGDGLSEENEPL